MLLAQSRIKRALAICLSFCFGWTFFACIWLCSHHSEQASEGRANYQTKTFAIPVESDHCPIEEAKGVVPGKQSPIDPSTDAVVQAFNMPPEYAGHGHPAALIHLPLSTADPPLEHLCVYRI
jgi:hypothetical protein